MSTGKLTRIPRNPATSNPRHAERSGVSIDWSKYARTREDNRRKRREFAVGLAVWLWVGALIAAILN